MRGRRGWPILVDMGPAEVEARSYIQELEEHLRQVVFECSTAAQFQAAVLLVRGALAGGDHVRAARLARATAGLAQTTPGDRDVEAAAAHVRGLLERDSSMLDRAAGAYSAPLARARATEDAGQASSARGDRNDAVAKLRQAYEQYERQGCAEDMARVRSQLRDSGVRMRHWNRADRPAFGWASLTDTERRIADLVAQGLSNREVADQVFLSTHTVAFHLRHIFWKLDIGSRVQLARMVAEEAAS
jgi:DNA-binding CsgD family transcriptional regulator